MKIKVKRPYTQTYKQGEIFFAFKTTFDWEVVDKKKSKRIAKKMQKCLKKQLNK